MSGYVAVAHIHDAAPGSLTACRVDGEEIALANVGGRYYAFSNICTHAECELADGGLDGTVVSCPCHLGQFDVVTGAVRRLPQSVPLRVYGVRVEGSRVMVELPEPPPKG